MKVILSRKGFDSANGGMPSLIMPNGDTISMPIPSNDCICYKNLEYKGKTYFEILKGLKPGWNIQTCHLDPDLNSDRMETRKPKGWKPAFGQIGASASYLMNTVKLKPGDIFLFFGNFRKVESFNNGFRFVRRSGDFYSDKQIQLIWGYLQVGEIITDGKRICKEYPWHPHAMNGRAETRGNILIIPSEKLSLDESKFGCGLLRFDKKRVLTMEGKNKGTWKINPVYSPSSIIANRKNQSPFGIYYAGIWQELGLKESTAAIEWAKSVIC